MTDVHYIWIGGSEIPPNYLTNYQRCTQLNPYFNFKVWRNEECLQLVSEYGLMDIFSPLTFICKYNLIKYIILHKFGGIYTDFDIEWNISFDKIINEYIKSEVEKKTIQQPAPEFQKASDTNEPAPSDTNEVADVKSSEILLTILNQFKKN